MGTKPERFQETIDLIASRLQGADYAIRGTASLVLQGLDMNVDDIDVGGDKTMALACNDLFKEFIISPVNYSESPKYKSYFGKFKINDILVEVYGDWQIKNPKGVWERAVFERVEADGIYLTSIESELKAYAAMGRWSVLHKIKRQLAI